MIVHQVYAMVDKKGMIQNIMVCDNYEEANRITRAVYGEGSSAVDCLQYACRQGDYYKDGRFYTVQENGDIKDIEYIPTQEQEVNQLKNENNELTLVVADIIGGTL